MVPYALDILFGGNSSFYGHAFRALHLKSLLHLKYLLYICTRNSIGINRRGYSGCSGLEKVVEKTETLKTCLDRCISNHAIYGEFSTISISSSVSPYKS